MQPAPDVYVLWHRNPPGDWREVFRGTTAACAAEESRLVIEGRWGGDFCRLPLGQNP